MFSHDLWLQSHQFFFFPISGIQTYPRFLIWNDHLYLNEALFNAILQDSFITTLLNCNGDTAPRARVGACYLFQVFNEN